MKTYKSILAALLAATVAITGCAKKNAVDTAPLEKNFQSAGPATQTGVDRAVAAIKSENYPQALTELKSLAGKAKLTPEQTQAIKDVLAQVEKALADTANKAIGEAGKALDDAKKALPK